MLQIAVESPLTPEAAALFALSDAYAAALYPAESNHMVDAESPGAAARNLLRGQAEGQGAGLRCGCAVQRATPKRRMRRSSACLCTKTRAAWVGRCASWSTWKTETAAAWRAHAAPGNGRDLAPRPPAI